MILLITLKNIQKKECDAVADCIHSTRDDIMVDIYSESIYSTTCNIICTNGIKSRIAVCQVGAAVGILLNCLLILILHKLCKHYICVSILFITLKNIQKKECDVVVEYIHSRKYITIVDVYICSSSSTCDKCKESHLSVSVYTYDCIYRKKFSMFSEMLKSLNGEIVVLIFSSLHFEQDNVTSNYDINHSNSPEGKIPRGESNTSFIFGYTTLCIADFHNPVNIALSTGIPNIRKMIHKITSSPTVHHPLYIHLSPYGTVEFNMLAGNNKIHIKTHKLWPTKYIFVH